MKAIDVGINLRRDLELALAVLQDEAIGAVAYTTTACAPGLRWEVALYRPLLRSGGIVKVVRRQFGHSLPEVSVMRIQDLPLVQFREYPNMIAAIVRVHKYATAAQKEAL